LGNGIQRRTKILQLIKQKEIEEQDNQINMRLELLFHEKAIFRQGNIAKPNGHAQQ
ncbi:hypothetical protein RRG08_000413, partial [Elysia crispata]